MFIKTGLAWACKNAGSLRLQTISRVFQGRLGVWAGGDFSLMLCKLLKRRYLLVILYCLGVFEGFLGKLASLAAPIPARY